MPTPRSRARPLRLWLIVVIVYFLWETAFYRGLTGKLAEWEFERFGAYLPTLTFALLVLLFALPALLLSRRRKRRRSSRSVESRIDRAEIAIARSEVFLRTLLYLAAAVAVLATGILLWTFTLPRDQGTTAAIAANTRNPAEGPARLTGPLAFGPTAAFNHGLILLRHDVHYTPVVMSTHGGDNGLIRYFIERPFTNQPAAHSPQPLPREGILVRGSLPGSLIRLYRQAGYQVSWPYYVLYQSSAAIRRPYYMITAEFLVLALLLVGVALFQRRNLRWLRARAMELEPG